LAAFAVHQAIVSSLASLEAETGIRVLYACESGSRAWGFASKDSDWDVRFFFVWPQREYLRVREPKDHMHRDLPGDLDITGWDLRKALHHALKSSASVLEWLESPAVYLNRDGIAESLRPLVNDCFRVRPTVHHYLGLAKQLWPAAGEGAALNGKKCLYVMRATLCARWALIHGTPPPVAFSGLLPLVEESAVLDEIHAFVTLKQEGAESDAFPVSENLRGWLAGLRSECEELEKAVETEPTDSAPLDAFFQETLAAWP
jgi:predicted nucleotidyltransferase